MFTNKTVEEVRVTVEQTGTQDRIIAHIFIYFTEISKQNIANNNDLDSLETNSYTENSPFLH